MGYNLTQINPAYELVKDIVVGTSTTSVAFSGLSFDKTDDLMLVISGINPTGTNSNLGISINGNTTATNYYRQSVQGNGSGIYASRGNLNEFSFMYANLNVTSQAYIKLSNNGYMTCISHNELSSGSTAPHIYDEVVTSTFTATSITQLDIVASVSNSIGVGSRFQLYKRVAEVVYDYEVTGSAITSLDITGLSIDKGSEYQLVSTIIHGANSSIRLFENADETATNYYTQYLIANSSTVSSNRVNYPYLTYNESGYYALSISNIKLTNNGYITVQNNIIDKYGGSSISIRKPYITNITTSSTITSLKIVSDTTNGIGIGSRFQLIKLK